MLTLIYLIAKGCRERICIGNCRVYNSCSNRVSESSDFGTINLNLRSIQKSPGDGQTICTMLSIGRLGGAASSQRVFSFVFLRD